MNTFDQSMADSQWDNHPDNPSNAYDNFDADWLYDEWKDNQLDDKIKEKLNNVWNEIEREN